MKLLDDLLDLLFPPKCPFCQSILETPADPVCPACQKSLPWLVGRAGERKVDFTQGCCSPLAYRGAVREAIHRYKFSGVRAYARPFGLLMAQCVQDRPEMAADLVTWAPLSRKRRRERGYDQGELLARAMAKRLGLPAVPTLVKARHTQPQSGLDSAEARRANALGAYALLPGADVAGRHVLLADDVVTSGATLSECARTLLEAGAECVWCVTLAQARPS